MFSHRAEKDTPRIVLIHWFLLSFLAGNVNAGGFLACGRFVTHVTGFATLFGLDAARGRWDAAVGILSVPLFFLLGVVISAYLIDRPSHRGSRPHYATVMSLVALCLVCSGMGGRLQLFGPFGGVSHLKQDYFLLALLCLASGMQNAAITSATGHQVRVTHLTGITTDLGIGIVRAWASYRHNRDVFERECTSAQLRLGTILSFALGSLAGACLFLRVGYLGFFLPAAIASYTSFIALGSAEHRRVRSIAPETSEPAAEDPNPRVHAE